MPGSIIVTGASAGIGRAVSLRFLEAGWRVGLVARSEQKLRQVAQGFDTAIVLPADVSDPDQVDAAFAGFAEEVERLDVLFNNAGVFTPAALIDETPLADWVHAKSVNLDGMLYAARAAFRQMRHQDPAGGRIINNGSVSAHTPRWGATPYTVTKHATTGLTRQLALDGRAFDIACGQIDIGNAETDLLRGIADAAIAKGEAPPPFFDVEHVADQVLAMADLPLSVNVLFQTIIATKMPFVGRG
ncbi:MAG: SDR family NAD(P)-dependent oxidoreductase [Proteobacteria bacterium]|nr:SDR family NAD(P)-dependent oxidoreductase [Pseudomonadota bacterium]